MIEEPGTVVATDGIHAEVRTERRSVCSGCAARDGCGTSLIERFLGSRPNRVRALNQAQAVVGERVMLGISEQGLLRASLAVYLVPVSSLVAGALFGEQVAGGALGARTADLAALLGAACGFALALLWLRGYSAGSRNRPEYQAVVVRRLDLGARIEIRSTP